MFYLSELLPFPRAHHRSRDQAACVFPFPGDLFLCPNCAPIGFTSSRVPWCDSTSTAAGSDASGVCMVAQTECSQLLQPPSACVVVAGQAVCARHCPRSGRGVLQAGNDCLAPLPQVGRLWLCVWQAL